MKSLVYQMLVFLLLQIFLAGNMLRMSYSGADPASERTADLPHAYTREAPDPFILPFQKEGKSGNPELQRVKFLSSDWKISAYHIQKNPQLICSCLNMARLSDCSNFALFRFCILRI